MLKTESLSPKKTESQDPSLLIAAPEAARLLGIGRATWHRLSAGGRNPRPVKLGGAVRWRRADIEAWISMGCPDRATFEAMGSDLT